MAIYTDSPDMDESGQLDILCGEADSLGDSGSTPRPWLGVQFGCCGVYARIFRRTDSHFYLVRCPQCGQKTTVRVGPGGVSARLFRAFSH